MADDLKDKVLELYLELFEKGQPISLSDLARRSMELFGESVSEDQVYTWSKRDDWRARVRGNFDQSPAMRPLKQLYDMWFNIWKEAEDGADRAIAAQKYAAVVQKIPAEFRSVIAEEILGVKEEILDCTLKHKDAYSKKQLGSLTSAWFILDHSIDIFVEVEHEGINLDALVLSGRI